MLGISHGQFAKEKQRDVVEIECVFYAVQNIVGEKKRDNIKSYVYNTISAEVSLQDLPFVRYTTGKALAKERGGTKQSKGRAGQGRAPNEVSLTEHTRRVVLPLARKEEGMEFPPAQRYQFKISNFILQTTYARVVARFLFRDGSSLLQVISRRAQWQLMKLPFDSTFIPKCKPIFFCFAVLFSFFILICHFF